jgi:Ion channel
MTLHIFVSILGAALLLIVLWDVFETIILPRRIMRKFRLARAFYRSTWQPWRLVAGRIGLRNRREAFLSFFGPLSLLFLFVVWAVGIVLAFALLYWGNQTPIRAAPTSPAIPASFGTALYLSGATIFTLGFGDLTPAGVLARVLAVSEAGIGLGYLAVVISYLPVLYQAFSRREVNISLLDARAGSPPTASEFIRRHVQGHSVDSLTRYLSEWEHWSAELMESHLSYPVLCYFRSLHNNQSWLAALATVLDVSALLIAYAEGELLWQAKLTFAISRHAVVDLAQVLRVKPEPPRVERVTVADLRALRELLEGAGLAAPLCDDYHLAELRKMYEPYVEALSQRLLMPVMGWAAPEDLQLSWRGSAWTKISEQRKRTAAKSR